MTETQKQKHTPAPWKMFKSKNPAPAYSTTWVIESDTRKVMGTLEVLDLNSNPQWRADHPDSVKEYTETLIEVEANAKLIVVAPELLIKAKEAEILLDEIYTKYVEILDDDDLIHIGQVMEGLNNTIRKALGNECSGGDFTSAECFVCEESSCPHDDDMSYTGELWDADPSCDHDIIDSPGGGVKCTKCNGWFCY